MLKDLETALAAALAQCVAMPVTSLIADLHRLLVAAGIGSADRAAHRRPFDLAAERSR
jgi:2-hydroxy-3-oxopropionate reductase